MRSRSRLKSQTASQSSFTPIPYKLFERRVAYQFKKEAKAPPVLHEALNLSSQSKDRNTGLPTTLKSRIEALSGITMDDVKVHYNSSQPAKLQASAYTQGIDIYVGPGQVKHLPHEAWHVVQQKQGLVMPTLQARGIAVNTDQRLEREADVMGAKAAHTAPIYSQRSPVQKSTSSETVQMYMELLIQIAQYLGVEASLTAVAGAMGIAPGVLLAGLTALGTLAVGWSVYQLINYFTALRAPAAPTTAPVVPAPAVPAPAPATAPVVPAPAPAVAPVVPTPVVPAPAPAVAPAAPAPAPVVPAPVVPAPAPALAPAAPAVAPVVPAPVVPVPAPALAPAAPAPAPAPAVPPRVRAARQEAARIIGIIRHSQDEGRHLMVQSHLPQTEGTHLHQALRQYDQQVARPNRGRKEYRFYISNNLQRGIHVTIHTWRNGVDTYETIANYHIEL